MVQTETVRLPPEVRTWIALLPKERFIVAIITTNALTIFAEADNNFKLCGRQPAIAPITRG